MQVHYNCEMIIRIQLCVLYSLFIPIAGENDYVPITVFSSPLVEPFDENIRKMSFTVTIIDDDVFELTEMFSIMVSPEIAGTVEITPNVGRITILDNDGKYRPKLLITLYPKVFGHHLLQKCMC